MGSNKNHTVKFSDAISSVSNHTLRAAEEIHAEKTKKFWNEWHERRRARQLKYVTGGRPVSPVTVTYKKTPLSILSPELQAAVIRECKIQGIRIDEVIVINSTTVEFP